MSEVRAFKLSSGEEVIAKIEQDFNDKVVISKPRVVQAMRMKDGAVGISLVPWIFSGSDTQPVTLFFSNIVTVVSPIPEMVDNYLRETSGLDLSQAAPKSILTG